MYKREPQVNDHIELSPRSLISWPWITFYTKKVWNSACSFLKTIISNNYNI